MGRGHRPSPYGSLSGRCLKSVSTRADADESSCEQAPPLADEKVLSAAGQYWAAAGGAEWASVASFSKHSLDLMFAQPHVDE